MSRIKIGINGFGRIGRALARLNLQHDSYDLVAINDIDPDVDNLAYLFKYDTTYGKLREDKVEVVDGQLIVNKQLIRVFCESDIVNVPWEKEGVDVVIDSSGVLQNVINARDLVDSRQVNKVVVTHAPNQGLDFTYMEGVNEKEYDKDRHHVISSSICDANAVTPFFKLIDDTFGIEMGEVTTLHPWLSYQNLVDGTIKSVSSPGHYWKDYALGRSSIGSLIPKDTTLCNAMEKVLPGIGARVHAASFRTPTSIVSAADGVFLLREKTSIEAVHEAINEYVKKYPGVLFPDDRSLVSIDYLGNEYGAVIDTRWLNLNMGRMLKFVLWYDNEWGYASRAYKCIRNLIAN